MGVYQFDLTFALCFSSKLFWNNIFLSEVAYGLMDVILFVTNFIFVFFSSGGITRCNIYIGK